MLSQHVALVPELSEVSPEELARVGAALQKQITRDVAPLWSISATVDAFPRLEEVPSGYWPIVVSARALGNDVGIHIDKHGQPFALVELAPGWSLAASHECIQMLTNPFGNRTVTALSPRSDQWQVEFLVQICDPCGGSDYAYTVNDVLVSDFCRPSYFERDALADESYSFTGALQAPFQVLKGGHLCWHDPVQDCWWMRSYFDNDLADTNLGGLEASPGSMRQVLAALAPERLRATRMTVEMYEARMGGVRQRASYASHHRAHRFRTSELAMGKTLPGHVPSELLREGRSGAEASYLPPQAHEAAAHAQARASRLPPSVHEPVAAGLRVRVPTPPPLPDLHGPAQERSRTLPPPPKRSASPAANRPLSSMGSSFEATAPALLSGPPASPAPPMGTGVPFGSLVPPAPALPRSLMPSSVATAPSIGPTSLTAGRPRPGASLRTLGIAAATAVVIVGAEEIYRAVSRSSAVAVASESQPASAALAPALTPTTLAAPALTAIPLAAPALTAPALTAIPLTAQPVPAAQPGPAAPSVIVVMAPAAPAPSPAPRVPAAPVARAQRPAPALPTPVRERAPLPAAPSEAPNSDTLDDLITQRR